MSDITDSCGPGSRLAVSVTTGCQHLTGGACDLCAPRYVPHPPHGPDRECPGTTLVEFLRALGELRDNPDSDAIRIIRWQRAERERWESRALIAEAQLAEARAEIERLRGPTEVRR